MEKFPSKASSKLQKRIVDGEFRQLHQYDWNKIDFLSNDYLGLARMAQDFKPTKSHGGSTGSRLISGNSSFKEEFEHFLAEFYLGDSALFFSSGFDANLAVISSIPQRGDTILYDQLAHASIREGIRLSHAQSFAFKHNDLQDLERLSKKTSGDIFVVVESVYSMDGDCAPLEQLVAFCHGENRFLIVDEAHGTGILGKNAKGLFETVDHSKIFARIQTFGKAMGSHGAAVVGSEKLKKFLVNFSRSFIYTTAPSDATVETAWHAHQLLQHNLDLPNILQSKIEYFHSRVQQLRITGILSNPQTPIQQYLADKRTLQYLEKKLLANDLLVRAIYSPTVPSNKERLRICLHAYNTTEEIDLLLQILSENE